MRRIVIQNGELRAVVLPDFGATVSELSVRGVEVLRMDTSMLGLSTVLAGGIPVLFPFVSRTGEDEAEFEGRVCTMPMHGFAKDLPFAVARMERDSCELRLDSNDMTKRLYPYDFQLRIRYEVVGASFITTAFVRNRSGAAMPYLMGYHPYFLTPDPSATRFSFGLREFWDYLHTDGDGRPRHGMREGELSLSDAHDVVFWNGDAACELTNFELGYRARITGDESFGVVTICTTAERASCVEPWQGLPGAARDRSLCRILQPGEEQFCAYRIDLERL